MIRCLRPPGVRFVVAALFTGLAALTVNAGTAAAKIEAGLLSCEVGEGFALILSKPRDLHCVFHKTNGQSEAYRGKLREVGADIGISGRGVIAWTVIADTTELPPGVLNGTYGGAEAGGAAVVGARGAVLVGGSRRTISLQPLAVAAEAGINIAVGVVSIELHPLLTGQPVASTARVPAIGYLDDSVPHARQQLHYGCGSYTHLQQGHTLFSLAHDCGVTLESLLEANPQITNARRVAAGALIRIPSHVGHRSQSPCGRRAVLQPDESIDQLAWRCGVTVHALLLANPGIDELSQLEAGLILRVPAQSQPRHAAPVRWHATVVEPAEAAVDASPESGSDVSRAAKRACLKEAASETGERNVAVLSAEFSEANSLVMVGVGENRAPWRCLVSNDGVINEFYFAGDDSVGAGSVAELSEQAPAEQEEVDALVPGTDFNATGEITCSRPGTSKRSCRFGVKREGNGNGSITVFWPDSGSRVIFFEDQTPMSYDESQADGGAKMTVEQKGDLYIVRIGQQRLEIPEAAIVGD